MPVLTVTAQVNPSLPASTNVAGVFRDLASDGAAVVITGHEVPSLLDVAHHVSWCTSGTTYELGPPAEATRHEAFRREYLGPWSTV